MAAYTVSMTAEAESELVERHRAGDRAAASRLLLAHRAFLDVLARRYRFGMDLDDARQEAAIAFLRAVDSFDPSRTRLASYAWPIVRHHLFNVAPSVCRTIRGTLYGERKAYAEANDGAPLPAWMRPPASLDAPLDDSRGSMRTVGAGLVDEAELPDHVAEVAELAARIPKLLGGLSEIEAVVIRSRLDGLVLREIGDGLGVSRERVRQIEEGALARMRRRFA